VSKGIREGLIRYRDTIYRREEDIVKILNRGKRTVWQVAYEMPIYKRRLEPANVFYLYECAMDWKHLERLQKLGRVHTENGEYFLVDGVRPSNLNLA
jgi:hypothetical protein